MSSGGGAGGAGKKARKAGNDAVSKAEAVIVKHNPWLSRIPCLSPSMTLPNADPSLSTITDRIARMWRSDFSWSASFDPTFLSNLMREGYLPTAHDVDGPIKYVLLPKLHEQRCLLSFPDLNVNRAARRASVRFQLSVDQRFDEVVEKCIAQHGESWLHPPIVEGFKELFRMGGAGTVRMHSVECYEGGVLVAGELGYSVGQCYCSLTGFSKAKSSGTVQLVALGVHLHAKGLKFWDFGMGMEYKHGLGASDRERMEFVERLHATRDDETIDIALKPTDVGPLLRPRHPPGARVGLKG
eukprot:CAMPEP_0173419256 /NCGR_PEP_ID=MMETSP1357-20121228/1172_1 /TAXON_ID=77926 /ORGANISM="Hemiselmis rufescens, Strain PCC563" /LENGTH=297 /DNA_ID=CAMNT_0014381877 /DNA_START=229 /DNA_END=1119 /DNA_ORIENTATION=-